MFAPKHFVSWYTHKGTFAFIAYLKRHLHHCIPAESICIMACTNGTFALWYTPKGTFASWHHSMLPNRHSHHGIPTREHLHHDILTWTFTSWHTYMNIYIMTYIHEHLHHGISTRGHLHHDIHTWTFTSWHTHKGAFTSWHTYMRTCIMTCPLESICTTRHFASSSL